MQEFEVPLATVYSLALTFNNTNALGGEKKNQNT
jgi:hypothetical protein